MGEEKKYELNLLTELSEKDIEVIQTMEKNYPQTTSSFKHYLLEEYIVFCKKQSDYGTGNIAVGTQLKTIKEIMVSLEGVWFRMNDKMQRLFNIILIKETLEANNESVEDSYRDLAVYSKIARVVKSGMWAK